jgi:hypothetical protein
VCVLQEVDETARICGVVHWLLNVIDERLHAAVGETHEQLDFLLGRGALDFGAYVPSTAYCLIHASSSVTATRASSIVCHRLPRATVAPVALPRCRVSTATVSGAACPCSLCLCLCLCVVLSSTEAQGFESWAGVDEGFVRIYRQQHLFGHTHTQHNDEKPPTAAADKEGEESADPTKTGGSFFPPLNSTMGSVRLKTARRFFVLSLC